MLKAFLGIGIGLGVAVGALAVIVFTSVDHREEVALERNILATKTAETRDILGAGTRNDVGNADDDSPPGEDFTRTPGPRQPLPEESQSPSGATTPTP